MQTPNYKQVLRDMPSPLLNVITELQDQPPEVIKEAQAKYHRKLQVCALNITSDLNIGNMIRTSSLMGVEKFIIMGRRKYDARSTVGAENYMDVEYVTDVISEDGMTFDVDGIIKYFDQHPDVQPVVLEQHPTNHIGRCTERFYREILQDIDHKDSDRKVCIIAGNEAIGVPQGLLDRYPVWGIPQYGVLRCHNVSISLAIMLWEINCALRGYV